MSKSSTSNIDQQTYDAVAKYLFKGSVAQVRKQFQELLFSEWVQRNQDVLTKAIPPVLKSDPDIHEKLVSILKDYKTITVKELLQEAKRYTTIKTLADLKKHLKVLASTHTNNLSIPKTLTGSAKLTYSQDQGSKESFLKNLRVLYDELPSKIGAMVELPILAKKLHEKLGLSEKEVYKYIYELYISKKVDLQPGKAVNGNPLVTEDGAKFYWFQFR